MIDPAELFRVYAPASKKETVEPQTSTINLLLKLKEIEAKFEVTEKRLLDKSSEIENYQAQINDLRAERDCWRGQAEQITRLLTDGREREREKQEPEKPRSW